MRHPLIGKYGRVELGVDGNAAFALLGPDLQEGEAEFVELPRNWRAEDELRGCKFALAALRKRLQADFLPFYFGRSHPYGS